MYMQHIGDGLNRRLRVHQKPAVTVVPGELILAAMDILNAPESIAEIEASYDATHTTPRTVREWLIKSLLHGERYPHITAGMLLDAVDTRGESLMTVDRVESAADNILGIKDTLVLAHELSKALEEMNPAQYNLLNWNMSVYSFATAAGEQSISAHDALILRATNPTIEDLVTFFNSRIKAPVIADTTIM